MHLGVIPDGNRRYARNNDVPKKKAYERASQIIRQIFRNLTGREPEDLDDPGELDEIEALNGEIPEIEAMTFYLLSEENLRREEEELDVLFELLRENISKLAESFSENDFSFNWASTRPEALPDDLSGKLRELEEKFSDGGKTLNVLISYSGKRDILQASEEISGNGADFSRDDMLEHLEIDSNIDFVIRTGNNPRRECLSGFPLWNSSYAEFYHIEKNFPALETSDVREAFDHYQKLRRKKGK